MAFRLARPRTGKRDRGRSVNKAAPKARAMNRPVAPGAAAVLEDARRAGLLDGERTEHVSFRAPPALIAAARRESGASSPTALGILALATLAQPDPVATLLKRTRGSLGETHKLDY
jgi:hypothetical protein